MDEDNIIYLTVAIWMFLVCLTALGYDSTLNTMLASVTTFLLGFLTHARISQ